MLTLAKKPSQHQVLRINGYTLVFAAVLGFASAISGLPRTRSLGMLVVMLTSNEIFRSCSAARPRLSRSAPPRGEAFGKQPRIHPIHQDSQAARAGKAVRIGRKRRRKSRLSSPHSTISSKSSHPSIVLQTTRSSATGNGWVTRQPSRSSSNRDERVQKHPQARLVGEIQHGSGLRFTASIESRQARSQNRLAPVQAVGRLNLELKRVLG